jgi:hypothetical protein
MRGPLVQLSIVRGLATSAWVRKTAFVAAQGGELLPKGEVHQSVVCTRAEGRAQSGEQASEKNEHTWLMHDGALPATLTVLDCHRRRIAAADENLARHKGGEETGQELRAAE